MKFLALLLLLLLGCKENSGTSTKHLPVAEGTEPVTEAKEAFLVSLAKVDGLLESNREDTPLVTLSKEGIYLGKKKIEIAPKDETGEDRMTRLEPLLEALKGMSPPPTYIRVLAGKQISYGELTDFITMTNALHETEEENQNIHQILAGPTGSPMKFGFLARTEKGVGVIPVTPPSMYGGAARNDGELPCVESLDSGESLARSIEEMQGTEEVEKPPCPEPLSLILSLASSGETQLLSLSGQEGSFQKPKLDLSAPKSRGPEPSQERLETVRAALAEIVDRRWPKTERSPRNRQILLLGERDVPAQAVLKWLATVRHDASGRVLFDDPLLSVGFQ